MRQKCFDVMAD